jgi:ketosteroid isomerase-like protein
MKLIKTTLAAAALTALAAVGTITAAHAATSTTTTRPAAHDRQQDPASVVLAYGKALDADNLPGVLKVFGPDPAVAAPGQPVHQGTAEVSKFYADLFTAADVQITFTIDTVDADRNIAYVTSHSLGTLVFRDGSKPFTGVGRELFVLNRTDDGWKIVKYWFNN